MESNLQQHPDKTQVLMEVSRRAQHTSVNQICLFSPTVAPPVGGEDVSAFMSSGLFLSTQPSMYPDRLPRSAANSFPSSVPIMPKRMMAIAIKNNVTNCIPI